MVIDLSNPVTSVVDPNRGTVTAYRTIVSNEGGRDVARTHILESNIYSDEQIENNTEQSHVHTQQDVSTEIVPEPPAAPAETNNEINVAHSNTRGLSVIPLCRRPLSLRSTRTSNQVRVRPSDSEMLEDILNRGGPEFRILAEVATSGNPHLRVSHLSYNNRIFAMLTAAVTERTESTSVQKPFGCIVWQTSKSPPRAVAVTLSEETDPGTQSSQFVASCSCNPSLQSATSGDNCCPHVKSVLKSSSIMDLFRHVLYAFHEQEAARLYFAEPLQHTAPFPFVHLSGALLGTIQNVGSRRCGFYIAFDTERMRFCPLVLAENKKVQCFLCRAHRSRRGPCIHEITWERIVSEEDGNEENIEFDPAETDYGLLDDDSLLLGNGGRSSPSHGHPGNIRHDPEVQKYCPVTLRLPLLPCREIRTASFDIAQDIEEHRGIRTTQYHDLYSTCKHCNYVRKAEVIPNARRRWRPTRLFTLCHQIVVIEVEDWLCPSCSKVMYFTGAGRGIFPVRKTYAFTYELMYFFVHNVCRLGMSFRMQYESYHMAQISQSAKAKFDSFSETYCFSIETCQSGRRRCAEALQLFIPCLDTSDPQLCSQLFTCKDCERDLTDAEKEMMGFTAEEHVPHKRFEAIAIDGTTAGILHSLPKYERGIQSLSVNRRQQTDQRFITSSVFQKSLRNFFKLARTRLRIIVSKQRVVPSHVAQFRFIIPTKRIRKDQKHVLSSQDLSCLRKLLLDSTCVCPDVLCSNSRTQHTALCRSTNRAFAKGVSGTDTIRFMCSLLFLEHTIDGTNTDNSDGHVEGTAQNEQPHTSTADDDDDDDDSILDIYSDDIDGIEDRNDSHVISHTTADIPGRLEINEDDDDEESTSSDDDSEDTERNSRKWFATLSVPNPSRCGQFLEAFFDVLKMIFLENVSIPYIRPCTQLNIDAASRETVITSRNTTIFSNNGCLNIDGDVIGFDSFKLHDRLATALEQYSDCQCQPSNARLASNTGVCERCTNVLAEASTSVTDVNPVFSNFVDQLLLHSNILKGRATVIASEFASAVREHREAATDYFETLTDNVSEDCRSYWEQYASCKLRPLGHQQDEEQDNRGGSDTDETNRNENEEIRSNSNSNSGEEMDRNSTSGSNSTSAREDSDGNNGSDQQYNNFSSRAPDFSSSTGISFPGRHQYRPIFMFDQLEGKQCGKRYALNSNHSPGLLTVQCACSNPKLIGYIIMTRAESTSLALSCILMFFPIPPAIVLYDNACNTLSSALLRIPWLLLFSLIIVDRFHYKGHTCNSFFDADKYRRLDRINTSSAEINNSKLKRSLYNMRFLRGESLVYYLNIRFALLNLNAKYYEVHNKSDVEDVDIEEFYSTIVQCSCATTLCQQASIQPDSDNSSYSEDSQQTITSNDGNPLQYPAVQQNVDQQQVASENAMMD